MPKPPAQRQQGWSSQTGWWKKGARHRRINKVLFDLHKIQKQAKQNKSLLLLLWLLSRVRLCDTTDCSPSSPPGSSVLGILQARIREWVAVPFSRGSFRPRDSTRVSCIAGRFFATEPPGKPKSLLRNTYPWKLSVMSHSLLPHGLYCPWNSPGQNTGVGSLSLLQGIVPTQGLNPGLQHCRQILYQLSHKGSLLRNTYIVVKLYV